MSAVGPDRGVEARPTVTVVGEAVLRAEPDEAILLVTLSALDDAPGAALDDVGRRSRALIALLDDLQIPAADRFTSGVSVQEEVEHTSRGRRSLGHRAASAVTVRLEDPDLIGVLAVAAGGGSEMPIEAGEQDVDAAIEVTYALEERPPTPGPATAADG